MSEEVSNGGAPVKVSCAIIEEGEKILVARRGAQQSQAGLWEFPGGKVDLNETAEEALVRELQEELGIYVAVERSLTPVVHSYPTLYIELIPFVCRIVRGKPYPHEHSEILWLHPVSASTLDWAPADIPILEEYLSRHLS
ncbi:MAG: (deoxy)nucleoside triphosphate pyrophosphohydrolase [Chitinispirillaceae bacterium]